MLNTERAPLTRNPIGISTNYAIPGGVTLYITNGVIYKCQ